MDCTMNLRPDAIPKTTLSNGMTISQIGFGTLSVQPNRDASDANAEITANIVAQALKAGYRHIDTAQSMAPSAASDRPSLHQASRETICTSPASWATVTTRPTRYVARSSGLWRTWVWNNSTCS